MTDSDGAAAVGWARRIHCQAESGAGLKLSRGIKNRPSAATSSHTGGCLRVSINGAALPVTCDLRRRLIEFIHVRFRFDENHRVLNAQGVQRIFSEKSSNNC